MLLNRSLTFFLSSVQELGGINVILSADGSIPVKLGVLVRNLRCTAPGELSVTSLR